MFEVATSRLRLLLAVGVLLAVAGCLGGSSEGEAVNTTEASPVVEGEQAPAESGEANLTFESEPVSLTVTASGSFAAQDGAFLGGGVREADTRTHDLTTSIPTGVPVHLNVTIEYDGDYSQLNGDLVLENVEVYDESYHKDVNTNTISMEAQIARVSSGGNVMAVVQADLTGASPERSYNLTASIEGFGDHIVPGVPVSVPVTDASEGFTLDANGSSLPNTAVWGPEGFVARMAGSAGRLTVDANETQGPGSYVVVAGTPTEPGTAPPRIEVSTASAVEDAGNLEVVPTRRSLGDWHRVEPGMTTTWTFNRSSPPVQAGLVVRPATPTAVASDPTGYLSGSLTSPAGTIVEENEVGIYLGNVPTEWLGSLGQRELVPGSYEAQVSLGVSTPFEATQVTYDLDR